MRSTSARRAVFTLILFICACGNVAFAQKRGAERSDNYPAKPIRIVVPASVGGGSDLYSRVIGQKISASMGQPVITDNRPGGGGTIGIETVVRAPADGYTLLFTTALLSVNASLRRLTYDTLRDLAPVTLIATVPLVLIVHPAVPAKSVNELIAFAKAGKGKINYAFNDTGSTSHLSGLLFKMRTGIDVTGVPYKGGGDALTALVSGSEVSFAFNSFDTTLPQIKAGRVRALAVTSAKPSSALPDVPSMNTVLPPFETGNWYCMAAPAGVPRSVITRLNSEVVRALNLPEVKEVFTRDAAEPVGGSPEQFRAFLAREIETYRAIIKQAGLQLQ